MLQVHRGLDEHMAALGVNDTRDIHVFEFLFVLIIHRLEIVARGFLRSR